MSYPKSIRLLVDHFSRLPSVGPKTAERYVFYLLKQNPEMLQSFAQAIAELKEKTITCHVCHSLSESDPCSICQDKTRDKSLLCVVANTRDMTSIESTKAFNGHYHVLGGLINTIDNIGPEKLNIQALLDKFKNYGIKEIILALAPNIEGETTALYIAKICRSFKVKVTKLARGLPTGSDLEYADQSTLESALKYRNQI